MTATAPGLMMPAFSVAISAGVVPRYFAWSTATGVTTATFPSATLVESHRPPRPTSSTVTSTGASVNTANPSAVTASKNDRGRSSCASARSRNGTSSVYASTNRSGEMGSPDRLIRSRTCARCGLVSRPVRSPNATRSASIMRAVVVLPLVPVRWMTGAACWGSPSSSQACRIRAMSGRSTDLCSASRPSSARSASTYALPAAWASGVASRPAMAACASSSAHPRIVPRGRREPPKGWGYARPTPAAGSGRERRVSNNLSCTIAANLASGSSRSRPPIVTSRRSR